MVTRAVVLTRRSVEEGAEESLGRQERSGVSFCLSQGWEVAEVVEERGSAWKRSVEERPDLAHALSLLRRGKASVLVVERVDRLTRAGANAVLDMCEQMTAINCDIYFLDLGSYGSEERTRVLLSLLGELARAEAVSISARQRASQADRRSRGAKTAGKPLTFYEKDGDKVRLNDREAARAIVDRALDGEPWARIANSIGWSDSRLRDWIRSPILAGYASYRGEPVLVDGAYVSATTDEPLMTAGERERILARFRSGTRGRPTSALLTNGIVLCTDGRKLVPSGGKYRCRAANGVKGFLVPQDELDDHVAGLLTFHIGMMDDAYEGPERDFLVGLAQLFTGPDTQAVERAQLTDQLAEVRSRVEQLETAHFVEGTLPKESYERLMPELRSRLELAQRRLSEVPASAVSTGFLRAAAVNWPRWSLHAQRAAVQFCVERVEIDPPGRPLKASVRVVWRNLPEASGGP